MRAARSGLGASESHSPRDLRHRARDDGRRLVWRGPFPICFHSLIILCALFLLPGATPGPVKPLSTRISDVLRGADSDGRYAVPRASVHRVPSQKRHSSPSSRPALYRMRGRRVCAGPAADPNTACKIRARVSATRHGALRPVRRRRRRRASLVFLFFAFDFRRR